MDTNRSAGIEDSEADASLWARVCGWVMRWSGVFSPAEILRDGLSRRLALRCCSWLVPLEACVRRLIIAAALAFDPARLSPNRVVASQPRGRHPVKANQPAGFRVLSLRGANTPRAAASSRGPGARPPRHLPFPGDSLLRLGPARLRQPQPSLRQPHPLIRRGRIYRYDPDYIPREERWQPLYPAERRSRAPPDAQASRSFRAQPHAEVWTAEEWRRVDMEWERILPAPGLAARIAALIRVVEDPASQVRRLARRLAAHPHLVDTICGQPARPLRSPGYSRLGPQIDEDLFPLCHATLAPPDTS